MKWLSLLFFLLPFSLLAQIPGYRQLTMAVDSDVSTLSTLVPENAYPTYSHYLRIMRGLADRYPDRCELEDWGTLPSGRKILALRLTENVGVLNDRPRVLCTAAMHGDETAGYWLLLRTAEELLKSDKEGLLGKMEIYLNPLANPDGAYLAGNHTLSGARRGNGNGVDLNRNYPDPDDGDHPDDNIYQPETRIFMSVAESHDFDLAINLHGGAEVFNYPWDTYRSRHADTDWWRRISREFAQRAQAASPGVSYFKDRHNGVTNGHDWYPIAGSRQDYMNYYLRCREATLEVSEAKRFPAHKLSALWSYIRPALYGYFSEASFGLHGRVRDAQTGRPLIAHLSIPGHDHRNSDIFTNGHLSDFHRYLAAGTYEVEFSAPGYAPSWHTVVIKDGKRTDLLVELSPISQRPAVEARRKR